VNCELDDAMYYYIFDIKKFAKSSQVENLKNYLGGLGISGEFTYPTPAQNVEELVDLGLSKQYTTIVAIGGDELANIVAGKLVGRKEAMGFIPIDASPSLCQLIGSNSWKEACDILRFRKLNEIRIGKTASQKYFLTHVDLQIKNPTEITLELKDFIIQTTATSLMISNFNPSIKKIGDDFLDIVMTSTHPTSSILSKINIFRGKKREDELANSLLRARSLRIFTKNQIPISASNYTLAKSPQLIESTDEYLRLITTKKAEISPEK